MLENENDPGLYNPQPVLYMQLTDFWDTKRAIVCIWVSESAIS